MADSKDDVRKHLYDTIRGKVMSLQEVADLFNVSPNTILRAVKETDFPKPIRIARSNRWLGADILAYMSGP